MATKEHIGEWIAIDQLKKWDKNPRDNSQAIDKVADSIKRFGFAAIYGFLATIESYAEIQQIPLMSIG